MIRAISFSDKMEHRAKRIAGSIYVPPVSDGDTATFWFFCPCGCDGFSTITVGHSFKPKGHPRWKWNGKPENASLTPSVRQKACGWHGHLVNGYWESI